MAIGMARAEVGASFVPQDPMRDLHPECRRMLEAVGYTYAGAVRAWVNVAAGRALAFDKVTGMTPDWLAGWLDGK